MARYYLFTSNTAMVFWLAVCLCVGIREAHAADEGIELNAKVVLIGASYAEDWPIDRIGAAFEVLNVGIGGEESSGMLRRFEADVVNHAPTAVIIWGFINDYFRSSDSDTEKTRSEIRANFRSMVELAKAHDIEPIIVTEVTMGFEQGFLATIRRWLGALRGKRSYQERINIQVREVNAWLRDLSQQEGLVLLDFEKALYGDDGERDPDFSQEDGSHISIAGYNALSRYALPILETALDPDGDH